MTPQHTKRPPFFCCRFVRLLTKKTVANELGTQACWLLAVIAATEDARGYTDPVTFFNEQLLPLVGLKSVDALDRVRRRAIEKGWLAYIPGGRWSGAGRYWVLVPKEYAGTDDFPTDEPPSDRTHAEQGAEQGAEQTAIKVRNKVRNILPVPVPVPSSATDVAVDTSKAGQEQKPARKPKRVPTDAEADPLFIRFYAAYPNKKKAPRAAKAFAKHKVTEELLARMLAAIEHQRRSEKWQEQGGRFIPHPATWLADREWEDVRAPQPPEAPAAPVIRRAAENKLLNPTDAPEAAPCLTR